MSRGAGRARAEAVGETVARYPEYEAAQKAVSKLIAADVPARDIAIVGIGLRSIERITGRLGYATAARSGAINGLLLGLLFSAFLVLGTTSVPIQAFIGVMFVGIALGMLLSIVAYSFVRRRRDFASAMQVVADHYDVTVASGSIGKARQVLGASAVAPVAPVSAPAPSVAAPPVGPQVAAPAPPSAPPSEPPRYGERVSPPAGEPGAPNDAAEAPGAPEGAGEGDDAGTGGEPAGAGPTDDGERAESADVERRSPSA